MILERASGILLHPTSFPGPYGIGDLGAEAYRFVDFLRQSGQKLWQILPLAPTGYGDSPYAAFSAFAGNPLLISPDTLVDEGLLEPHDLRDLPNFPSDRVDYGTLIDWKMALLRGSYRRFVEKSRDGEAAMQVVKVELDHFAAENAVWLDDYALFMALKGAHGGAAWSDWEEGLALRRPESIAEWRLKLADEIGFQHYIQYLFSKQWMRLKGYANTHDVKVIGDVPIFVAYDSSDVWANHDLFHLDEKGRAIVVAGVPPDYFSPKGQYWGNPLYRWETLAADGYGWWIERLRNAFRLYDIVRLDHFRGFAAHWEVPVNDEETAANGRWVKGPGVPLFRAIHEALGDLPIIAEDLGVITPDVAAIRETMGYPGMRVLQFAFGAFESDATDPYLPHNFEQNTVVYTGTHDNDTTVGWYRTASEQERANVRRYLDIYVGGEHGDEEAAGLAPFVAWKLTRLSFGSVANTAIVPLQDLLGLGSAARMNWPGRAAGNWTWRYLPDSLTGDLLAALRDITLLFARYVPPTDHPLKGQGNI
ncbi:MAG: 4-alpha-glucanotransferase [Chloroflexota bacterium]|nr:4-alpha-glucanotransferase [Chloroflexota bacterium]